MRYISPYHKLAHRPMNTFAQLLNHAASDVCVAESSERAPVQCSLHHCMASKPYASGEARLGRRMDGPQSQTGTQTRFINIFEPLPLARRSRMRCMRREREREGRGGADALAKLRATLVAR